MADITNPYGDNKPLSSSLLPNIYKTDANKRFLQATLDQLVQPGVVKKVNGYIGRPNSKATTGADIFLKSASEDRQHYQLEPSFVINDKLGNTEFFKDYIDYINQLGVFEADISNHARINKQEFYSWDPHIDWDKFVNFQNYYWLPYGPETIKIYGQQLNVTSTYTIDLQTEGSNNQLVFTPDGLTPNPVITLYRGQTYTFNINSMGDPISIRSARTTANSDLYTPGVNGQSIEKGNIVFTVPLNAPNILYYQSDRNVALGGVFQISSVEENTYINISKDLLGKATYKLADGTALSNGMKVSFSGNVTPASYAQGEYYVEGVGSAINLVNKKILEVTSAYTVEKSVLFDSDLFDSNAFSDTTGFAQLKDYITINRASTDHNPWSRYNRWFHKDIIEISARLNGHVSNTDQTARAVRPIIEFEPNLKLFNFGTTAIDDIDLVDNFTIDVFSTIEGSKGYSIDGIFLTEGMKVLFTADTDNFVKNKIYQVKFVDVLHLAVNSRQIHLVEIATPVLNQVVLIKQGLSNQGLMYWFNGSTWTKAQTKNQTNQTPLFDVVDDNGVSFGDLAVYEGSSFNGTKLFSYKIASTGTVDPYLGFILSYRNIANIGDIAFNFNLISDTFQYKNIVTLTTIQINTGFLSHTTYAGTTEYFNGWQKCNSTSIQAGVRIYKNSNKINNFDLDIFDDINNLQDLQVKVYINGVFLSSNNYTIVTNSFYKQILLATPIGLSDVLTIKAYSSQAINSNGYYEIPLNLQNNPLNDQLTDFTLGEVIDHVNSIIDHIPASLLDNDDDSDLHTPEVTVGNRTYDPDFINIRDLGNITQYGTKFVQHSAPASLSLYHITNQTNNIVRALERSREEYAKFKKIFASTAESLNTSDSPRNQVDNILKIINKDKTNTQPYYFSDMAPYGSSIETVITVIDYRIQNYPLNNSFTLATLSSKAVNIYVNNTQLVYERDYIFNTQGFVTITSTLANGDIISIYEYESTDGCFIPETPTKLGIYPKYTPRIYLDTSLLTPQLMIQGHDGSQILAYGDYRDDIILELEKRIFNNIKIEYNTDIFDIADTYPSYIRSNDYSLKEYNQVLAPSFYKWLLLVDTDYTKNSSYHSNNSFTYNYRGLSSPTGMDVPGYWKGIYRYFYDTDRPNICPWEMLGFTIEPSWWVSTYGPSPYTSDNLVMWTDIANGVAKGDGTVPGTVREKYKKPYLVKHIPVDDSGNLVSPAECGIVSGTITKQIESSFIFGDVSPVESAWRRSSHYPFSLLLASMLLTPAKTFGVLLDRSRITRNIAGQLVYTPTGLRIRPSDIVIPSIESSSTRIQTAGLINYLVNYILSDNLSAYVAYAYDLANIQTRLSHRIGAFTSKQKFNLILDSKTPLSSGSVFVPQEDYNIILNTSSPIKKISYSGVVITKLSTGFEVKGYNRTQPYFKYYPYLQSGSTITIGGISEAFTTWTENQTYVVDKVVKYINQYYRVTTTHTSGNTFQSQYFVALGTLPVVGGKSAIFRKTWDRTTEITVPYGSEFSTIQDVVDFLLGYGEHLKDQGFIFDDFNANLNAVTNWETSAKEFLFWTTQNWSSGQDKWDDWVPNKSFDYNDIVKYNGEYYKAIAHIVGDTTFQSKYFVKLDGLSSIGSSVLSLSPAADKIIFKTPLSVVDDIRNQFNGYEIYKVDGTPLEAIFINSYRADNAVSYSPRTADGIYGATFYLIQHEHIVLLNNTTVFNDTIYNPPTGYKQDRIKVAGYVSTDWYGGFDIPGFILDLAKIVEWAEWTDYDLGDIVKHKEFYYTASKFLAGAEVFVDADWIKLDTKPSTQLLPNWTYKAGQFTDFYSLDSDNFDNAQQKVAQHLIGYQKRQYLSNIIQDDVSEYKFYQGMIREKGTRNVLNKLFDVLSADNRESLTFYEEWALRVAQYGASNAFENIEFVLNQTEFSSNTQGFELVNSIPYSLTSDFIIRQTPNDVYLKPLGYNSAPWPLTTNYQPFLNSAGFVRSSEVFKSLGSLAEIIGIDPSTGALYDITTFDNGCYIQVTFDNNSWNVYKFTNLNLKINSVTYSNSVVTLTTSNIVSLKVDQYVGISQAGVLNGFYKITSVSLNSFTVSATIPGFPNPFTQAPQLILHGFVSQKINSMDELDSVVDSDLEKNQLAWVENYSADKWATIEYSPVYEQTTILNSFPTDNLNFGKNIIINKNGNIAVTAMSTGEVRIWDKAGQNSPWIERQTIVAPTVLTGSKDNPINSKVTLSTILAISDDAKWLAVGSPLASNLPTRYVGNLSLVQIYQVGDIVSNYNSTTGVYTFYQSLTVHSGGYNFTTRLPDPTKWKSIPYLPVDVTGTGTGLAEEGVVSLYQKDSNNIYTLVDHIVSPTRASSSGITDYRHLTAYEHFGETVVFADNAMWISTPGYKTLSSGAVRHPKAPYIKTGIVRQFVYDTIVLAKSPYNPVGSSGTTLTLTSTAGILPGMNIAGVGFTNQYVVSVINSTSLVISLAPNSTPTGIIYFTNTYWHLSTYNVGLQGPLGNILFINTLYRSGTTATVTYQTIQTKIPYTVGSLVTISGTPYATFNGTFTITEAAVDHIKFTVLTTADTGNGVTYTSVYTPVGNSNWDGVIQPANSYADALRVSTDNSKLIVSGTTSGTIGAVYVYVNPTNTTAISQTIIGQDYFFGLGLDLTASGNYLAIGDIISTVSDINQGSVSVYKFNSTTSMFESYQTLINHSIKSSGYFGTKVAFMNNESTLVVYSQDEDTSQQTTFDIVTTTFDKRSTMFTATHISSGRIDVYDRYASNWVFSETLPTSSQESDGYGLGFAVGANHILVGAPYGLDSGFKSGKIYDYYKLINSYSWNVLHYQVDRPDPKKIKKAFLYNKKLGILIKYLDVIDVAQGKIAGLADEEIKFKTFYDPAVYSDSTGNHDVVTDNQQSWSRSRIGMLWWDLRTAKFNDAYDNDVIYRNSSWNTLATGASVDVYEWVESTILPAVWDQQSGTVAGLAANISGTSLYGNDVYSKRSRYDTLSQTTKYIYYFWVKNKTTIPNIAGRHISAANVASLIENPRGYNYSYLALTGSNSFSLVNITNDLNDADTVLSVEYWTIDKTDQNIHQQFKLISNDPITTLPVIIEQKWVDSLCGKDKVGREVPDPSLPVKLRYGIENRPRQGMFINRFEALKEFVDHSNIILASNQITTTKNISNLQSYELPPSTITGLFDLIKTSEVEIPLINTGAFIRPVLGTPVITDGKIISVPVLNAGRGYLYAPYITINGSGKSAVIKAVLGTYGQISSVTVLNSGEGYTSNTTATIRDFSVLVESDSQAEGFWSIYSYNPVAYSWERIRTQSYDVRNFWEKVDWYLTGYNQFSAIDFSVDNYYGLNTISTTIGQLVKVRNANSGGWILLEKYSNSVSTDWTQSYRVVGSENGTIQLKSTLYQSANTTIGYDGSIYDNVVYDNSPSVELRVILQTLKNNIFIDDLKQDYLNLFFTTVRYALSEQLYLDWIFKTSFVKSTHNLGALDQPVTYKPDNLSNFQDYISEVVPYRTTVREYISAFSGTDTSPTLVTDFDLPPIYENGTETVINAYVKDGIIQSDDTNIQSYPWKNWLTNVGFKIIDLKIVDGGAGYISEPVVTIASNSGSGATARAFFANGVVNRIVILTPGAGYLSAPKVTLSGGIAVDGRQATAIAIIGEGVTRSNLIKIKFDRTSYSYNVIQLSATQIFVGKSNILQFALTWAPDIKIGNSSVTINGVLILRDLYTLTTKITTVNGTKQYSGLITFSTAPANDAVVVVNYIKNEELLNALDRIQYHYKSSEGLLGADFAQLMSGIDYGGVIVNGLGFDVATGWGTLPYYSDKWDSADPTFNDYIVTVAPDTHAFTLPYTPDAGVNINVYHQVLNIESYVSDGVQTVYPFSLYDLLPIVTANIVKPSLSVQTNYVPPVGNYVASTTLKVVSTNGIVSGMTVFGTGFATDVALHVPLQKVVTVVNGTTLILNVAPNSQPNGVLTFTKNIAGTKVITLEDVTGISLKDVVSTSSVTAFGQDTIVTKINTLTKEITLNQITFVTLPMASDIVFARPLSPVFSNYTAILSEPLIATTNIVISSFIDAIRIDDVNFGTPDQTNANAVMVTPVMDGISSTITIPNTVTVSNGDRFILRQSTSDGSVKPLEQDYDTALTGGDMAYSTAVGLSPDDIIVDGDDLISTTTSPAPEEVVPGQVVDTLAIKVYDQPTSGSSNIKVDKYIADGKTISFKITQDINNPRALIVKNNDSIVTYNTDYTVDYKDKQIVFHSAPLVGHIISIFSFGFNGSNILDIDSFIGDGTTTEFLTKAPWLAYETGLVYVNGVASSIELFKTDSTYDSSNRTGIRFGVAPPVDSVINYVIVSGSQQTFSIAKTERIATDGVNKTYPLAYPVGKMLPNESGMIVRVDQTILSNPINQYFTIGRNKLNYSIDKDRALPYSITIDNILVYVSGVKLNLGTDYTIDLGGITVTITKQNYTLYKGQVLTVSVIQNNGYVYIPETQQIVFENYYSSANIVEVISFYNHDILDIERTAFNITTSISYTQDTVSYFTYTGLGAGLLPLDRPVLNDAYVWVVKNNQLLTPSVDYKVSDDKQTVLLKITPALHDTYSLMTFSSNVLVPGISYMQFKDMLNRVHFKRLSKNKQTRLATDLHYNDIAIQVIDASNFDVPNPALQRPGIIEIYGERIEFFQIEGNTLSQLRRGTQGTGTPRVHPIGTPVQDIGPSETLPYTEKPVVTTVISDNSNIINLPFVPVLSNIDSWFTDFGFTLKGDYDGASGYTVNDVVIYNNLYYANIKTYIFDAENIILPTNDIYWTLFDTKVPVGYGSCDQIEVFIAGYNDAIEWIENTAYTVGIIVQVAGYTYRCIADHNSSTNFLSDADNWQFFVGNLRLKKKPYKIHNESVAPYSPAGDIKLDAEFAVDGISSSLRLTNLVPAGTQITIVRRKGTSWDSSLNIQYDTNDIANFLKATPAIWYTDKIVPSSSTVFKGTFDNSSVGFDDSSDTW